MGDRPVCSPIWFRNEAGWQHMWACLEGGTLSMYQSPVDEARGGPPVFSIDVQKMGVTQLRSADALDNGQGKRFSKCIELRAKHRSLISSSSISGPAANASTAVFAAESAVQHAKWLNRIEACTSQSPDQSESQAFSQVDLSPDPEVVALLTCRQPNVIQAVNKARRYFQQGSDDITEFTHSSITLLKELHGAILCTDIELEDTLQCNGSSGLGAASDENSTVDSQICSNTAAWLNQLDIYVTRLSSTLEGQASALATEPDAARYCCHLLADADIKLRPVDVFRDEEPDKQNSDKLLGQGTLLSCKKAGQKGTSRRQLVPSARQNYTRFWASKVCL